MPHRKDDALAWPVRSHVSHRIRLLTVLVAEVLLAVVLQVLDLDHEQEVAPSVVVDDRDVSLFEHTRLGFFFILTLMCRL